MTAHKHAAMIKAKADDMDLVVFCDGPHGKKWHIVDSKWPSFSDDFDYFLCLPQHKEACLHWLNGGEIQEKGFYNECEFGKIEIIGASKWRYNHIFMDNSSELRIKPRKEKHWIAVNNSGYATPMTFINKQECESYVSVSYPKSPVIIWQFIEIELEV